MILPEEQLLAPDALQAQIGVKRESAEWITIDQEMINAFADVTRDHQFIHVDPVRASETPFGTTLAHGYLTLSLLPPLLAPILLGPKNPLSLLNYGINRARFPLPVKVDSRIRACATLKSIEPASGGRLLFSWDVSVEVEGQDKPALVAEVLYLWIFPQDGDHPEVNIMKAVLCEELGPPECLKLRDIDIDAPAAGEVQITIEACGINFPDLLIIEGKYQERPPLPFIPCGEVAGTVAAVGESVSHVAVGDPVMAVTYKGGLAERINVSADAIIPRHAFMPAQAAAGFPGVYGTSYYALKQRARLQPGETLLVLGAAGGVGLAAVQLGLAMGARVIAAAGGEDKARALRELGATDVIDYRACDLKDRVKELTDGLGADVVYDPVGGDQFDQVVRCTRWNGRILVVGFASGRIANLPVNLTLLKGISVVGVFYGRFEQEEPAAAKQNMIELMQLYEDGAISPHIHRVYPLEQYADALTAPDNAPGRRQGRGRNGTLTPRQFPDYRAPVVQRAVEGRPGHTLVEAVGEHLIRVDKDAADRPGGNARPAKMHAVGASGLHVGNELEARVAGVYCPGHSGHHVGPGLGHGALGGVTQQPKLHLVVGHHLAQHLLYLGDGDTGENAAIDGGGGRLRQRVLGVTGP